MMNSGVISEVLIGFSNGLPSTYCKIHLEKANTNGDEERNEDGDYEVFHNSKLRFRNGCTVTVQMGVDTAENFMEGIILGCCDIPELNESFSKSHHSAVMKTMGEGNQPCPAFWYSVHLSNSSGVKGLGRGVMHEVNPSRVKYSARTATPSSSVTSTTSIAPVVATATHSAPATSVCTNSATGSIDLNVRQSPQHEIEMRESRAPLDNISVLNGDTEKGRSSNALTRKVSHEMRPSSLESSYDNNTTQNVQRKEPQWLVNAIIASNGSFPIAVENDVSSIAPIESATLGNDVPFAETTSTRPEDKTNNAASSGQGTKSTEKGVIFSAPHDSVNKTSTFDAAGQDSLESRDCHEPNSIPSSTRQKVGEKNPLEETLLHLPPYLSLTKQSAIINSTLRAFSRSDLSLQIELIKDMKTTAPSLHTSPMDAYKLTGTDANLLDCAKKHLMHQLESLVPDEKKMELKNHLIDLNKKKTFVPRKALKVRTSNSPSTTSSPAKSPVIEALNSPLSSSRKRKSESIEQCAEDRINPAEHTQYGDGYSSYSSNVPKTNVVPEEVPSSILEHKQRTSNQSAKSNHEYSSPYQNEIVAQSRCVTYELDLNIPLDLIQKLGFGGVRTPELQGFMRATNCYVALHSKYTHEQSCQIYFQAESDYTAQEGTESLRKRLGSIIKNKNYGLSVKESRPKRVIRSTTRYVRQIIIPSHDKTAGVYNLSSMIRGELMILQVNTIKSSILISFLTYQLASSAIGGIQIES